MTDNNDMIWVEDAARQYGRSREWLMSEVKEGNLNKYEIKGDRKVYLSRTELDKLFQPKKA